MEKNLDLLEPKALLLETMGATAAVAALNQTPPEGRPTSINVQVGNRNYITQLHREDLIQELVRQVLGNHKGMRQTLR